MDGPRSSSIFYQYLPLNHSPHDILKHYWGFDNFRGRQEEIIQSVLDGRHTLAILPTGGGKSLCYQVPGMLKDGICLVVTPLIALMKDQVEHLHKKGIAATALQANMAYQEVRQTLQQVAQGEFKFLYVSPERLQTRVFREYLPALNISLLAIDEAHCISQWGFDFRPSYRRIITLLEELPKVTAIAVTASATEKVEKDILAQLRLKTANIFRQSVRRDNISYSVFHPESKINKLYEILQNVPGSSVVYCRNRKVTHLVAQLLQHQGFTASHYHAGLPSEERSEKQVDWVKGATRVIVATSAFGMGIDKPDVRTVIHYDIPDAPESYYQEAGRAGRDGKRAYAVALFQEEDIKTLASLPEQRFPDIPTIRRVYQSIADYLDIPVGSGEGKYFDFDIAVFAKNFQYNIPLVINVLKYLELEGHLSFNEAVFIPARAGFRTNREVLEEVEQSQAILDPLVKCLLRSYEGIFDNVVTIYEGQIARLIRQAPETVKQQLQQLQQLGILEYHPQKETPQLYFLLNRAPASYLNLDHGTYLQRKQQYAERVDAMRGYLHTDSCRSQYLAAYFGEKDNAACGICDNCLKAKAQPLNSADVKRIWEHLRPLLSEEGIELGEVLSGIPGVSKEKAMQAITFLITERQLQMEGNKLYPR